MQKVSQECRIEVRDAQGRKLIKTKVRDDVERRMSWKPRGAVHMVRERGEFVHIDCKVCGNSWEVEKDGEDWEGKFEVQEVRKRLWRIRCRRCGREYESG